MPIAGDFELLWDSYPKGFNRDHSPGVDEAAEEERISDLGKELKRAIGGQVENPAYVNLCVIRLSFALNRCGMKIPEHTPPKWYGLKPYKVAKGADGYFYGLGVTETLHYLQQRYGKADLVLSKPFDMLPGSGDIPKSLQGKLGILVFLVSGWSDASGHVTLWNGKACSDNGYFGKADKVYFWEVIKIDPKPIKIDNLNDSIRLKAIRVPSNLEQ